MAEVCRSGCLTKADLASAKTLGERPRTSVDQERNLGQGLVPDLRLYSPLQPFFDKSWRPSEIKPHNPGSD